MEKKRMASKGSQAEEDEHLASEGRCCNISACLDERDIKLGGIW